ncbi:LysM peptidoglycan-binding domain-containing protein [Pseudomonas sp. F1_0610]|uniref:LysM peptidoglycan-binding domain-containing protein n=1 Tax=Pseudomonas sp. F1_0610 TaxID=3114284 RepID=UPI0039C301BF
MRKSLLALLLLAVSGLTHAEVQLKQGHPESYTVVKGDTLWAISGKFLTSPWKWPELWHANPQIKNPHLIYPGDTLSLIYVDGKPRLTLTRGASRGTVKLSPKIRSTSAAEAIPTIPLEAINGFLLRNRIIDKEAEYTKAPYVLGGQKESILAGIGDRIYTKGKLEEGTIYNIFRLGKVYKDPKTKEFLGINLDDMGSGEVIAMDGDVGSVNLIRSTQEIQPADRLFITEERAVTSIFVPSEPKQVIDGVILDVPRGVTQVGTMDVVTINKGAREQLEEGNVLSIYRRGELIRDRVSGKLVKAPDEKAGLMMVFRVYDKISYALVLHSTQPLRVNDVVKNPR